MSSKEPSISFKARLLCPAQPTGDGGWVFVCLPEAQSAKLPRRGRTTVAGTVNGHAFEARLEPDGQLSHWLRLDPALQAAAGALAGDWVSLQLEPLAAEPEPPLPIDLLQALMAHKAARSSWDNTTSLARLDWIHWIESAKQLKTRAKRVSEACDKLGAGQKRVCCFDPSGYYSKAFKAPLAQGLVDEPPAAA